MRMSCVILQRRLPRRSVLEIGFVELPVGSFFVINSCWVAMGKLSLPKTAKHHSKECNPRATAKPIVGTYPEGSGTFLENRSTEVLQKGREGPVEKARERAITEASGAQIPIENERHIEGQRSCTSDGQNCSVAPGKGNGSESQQRCRGPNP